MIGISKSVGKDGKNDSGDVTKIQILLNSNLHNLTGIKKLTEDGKISADVIAAITAYQNQVQKTPKPDGLVSDNGHTIRKLNETKKKPRPGNVTAFINLSLSSARAVNNSYGIPVSVIIAQSAIESGWGEHVKGNAYFGIKSHKDGGASTTFTTTEVVNGKRVTIKDSFKAYNSYSESAVGYGKFLSENSRYNKAFLNKKNVNKFIDEIAAAGYATDPDYAKKLKSIIRKHNLSEYDVIATE